MASGDRKRRSEDGRPPRPSRFIPQARGAPALPWMPRAGYDHELEKDSKLVRAARSNYPEGDGENSCTEFPPLMQAKSWTKGVPYRDSFEHNRPADTIGNCYTPSTKTMRIVHMPPKKRPPAQLFGPLGPNGETQFPPLRPWAEREKERLAKLERDKERNVVPKGIVRLEDLISGEYERRKAAEKEAKRRMIQKKRREQHEKELAEKEALRRFLEKREFELPRDPDDQKQEMIKVTEEEHYRPLDEDEMKRIDFYLTKSVVGKYLPDFPQPLYDRAQAAVNAQTAHIKQRLYVL